MGFWDNLGSVLSGVGSVASAGYGIYSGIQAGNLAGQYYDLAANAANQQYAMSQEDRDRYLELYGGLEEKMAQEAETRWDANTAYRDMQDAYNQEMLTQLKGEYLPTMQSMWDEANAAPDYASAMGRASSDVTQAYNKAQQENTRTLGRYGVNAGSGMALAANRELMNSKAIADAAARTGAYTAEQTDAWNKKAAMLNAASGLSPISTQTTTPNTSLLTSSAASLGNASSTYQNLAGVAANASTGAWAGGIYGLNQSGIKDVISGIKGFTS